MTSEQEKEKLLAEILKLWKTKECSNLTLGSAIHYLIQYFYAGSPLDYRKRGPYLDNSQLLSLFEKYWQDKEFCCGTDFIVFSGETIDNKMVYICDQCYNEGSVVISDPSKVFVHRPTYLKLKKQKNPKSDSIPVLLEKYEKSNSK